MDEKLSKPYNPSETEKRIYKKWEDSGFFNPENCISAGVTKPDTKAFTIVMPPPNVTGVLHMGHALMLTLEDIMVRYKRMRGFRTLWLPGTDHAAIATQSKVEKEIYKKEGKSRHDLGREELLKRIEQFAKESHDTIVSQIKIMGASCDWSREAFTLDKKRTEAVYMMFKKMYNDGLIYRGTRIVNWDPKGQTTIADDEIIYEERETKLYTFKYSKDFPVSISTTRPETKVGDTAVAVHPGDPRYQKFIGKEYNLTFCGVPIHLKIIADATVEKDFGTGAVGVTPAHSQIDWQMALRHDLPIKQVISEYAKMTVGGDGLIGKKTSEAREIIVSWLQTEGLLEKEETIKHNVATAERTGGIIEPLPKLQWFVDVNKPFRMGDSKINGIQSGESATLKDIMRKTVESGQIKIIPDYFNKTYFHWIENLRDWCISRQIWYGQRIPVWYHEPRCIPRQGHENEVAQCKELIVSAEKPICQFCNAEFAQDEDTLDTWFSSGLWTFSTLGWPDKTGDLAIYHPTDVLETGYEIIFFWVARMILMTGYALGDIPFHTVYLHGTVRDAKGRKMSKSLGNGIDPLDIAEKFGSDASRMALIVGSGPGTDIKISGDKINGYKHFGNKLWNIARFVLSSVEESDLEDVKLSVSDANLLKGQSEVANSITDDLENHKYHLAAEKIYHYIWHEFADKIIEESKPRLMGGNIADKKSAQYTLLTILKTSLKLLHPFMPFVTEELWGLIPKKSDEADILMIEKWPQ